MSVHINIRIPDELAARIDATGIIRSRVVIEALGAYLKQPTVIQAPPMSPEAVADFMKGMDDIQKALDGDLPNRGILRAALNSPEIKTKMRKDLKKGIKKALKSTAKRALGRTPENLSLADNRDSRLTHAPGCKCLMCQGK